MKIIKQELEFEECLKQRLDNTSKDIDKILRKIAIQAKIMSS